MFLTNGYMGGCSKMFAVVKCWFNIQITNGSRYTLGGKENPGSLAKMKSCGFSLV